jgi:hypothetical protein
VRSAAGQLGGGEGVKSVSCAERTAAARHGRCLILLRGRHKSVELIQCHSHCWESSKGDSALQLATIASSTYTGSSSDWSSKASAQRMVLRDMTHVPC